MNLFLDSLLSFEQFILMKEATFDEGETFEALKHSIVDLHDESGKKIGKLTLKAGDKFEVSNSMQNEVEFKCKEGYIILSKIQANNLFTLV